MIYHCCQENRRIAVANDAIINGIDYLEVLDKDAPMGSPRQQTLLLRLFKPVPLTWTKDNVFIQGGERVRNPAIDWIAPATNLPEPLLNAAEIAYLSALESPQNVLVIRTKSNGDYSDYCLILQKAIDDLNTPPDNFDPQLAKITFSFKVECQSDFDCQTEHECSEELSQQPDLNYLSKDYASFRQLILDRMSYLLPDWDNRSPADLGVALAEVIAYVGDKMSYWQDAVATEAYLNTARKRISLRRHTLLVDYQISEGRNARSWVFIEVSNGPVLLPAEGVQFLTQVDGLKLPDNNRIEPGSKQHALAQQQQALVFELLKTTDLYVEHNEIHFYTWGDERCCLPQGATTATLLGHYPQLSVGQYLLFEEIKGPTTGVADDADPKHRQVIRLTKVVLTEDPLPDPETNLKNAITEIHWSSQDALRFSVCVSSLTNSDSDSPEPLSDVSVVRGNIVLVDHGETIDETLDAVPEPWLYYPADKSGDACDLNNKIPIPPRYTPKLNEAPLSHGAAAPGFSQPALGTLQPELDQVAPLVISLTEDTPEKAQWSLKPDLLASKKNDTDFVVELNNEGVAQLRFGDDNNGARPNSLTEFNIRYRVGNGTIGNVGAEGIKHIVSNDDRIVAVRNPLAAQGGLAAETAEQIRRRAPQAFRTQLRAVNAEDYAEVTSQFDGVQQAQATPRWTGSWHTQTIIVDRDLGLPMDKEFEERLLTQLERYRMAGHDLNFNDPIWVSLELEIQICVSRNYFKSDVEQALLNIFNSGQSSQGEIGLFHADNFTFGQTIYLSPIYAAARQVAGVSSVKITKFSRQGDDDPKPLSDGFMTLGEFEIARLDNNPNFPENGILKLKMLGGK
ncbi:putative baseplate assembly protein [Aliikangiella sp. IMCC44359]|uniref:putative baseplate assembly protein n=1 Tax=Aliikangiella sp. IMCC44359 TaxID=3459125 RepID=UPI00403B1DDA